MKRLKWLVFPFFLVVYIPWLTVRNTGALLLTGVAWLLKWVLAFVVLAKHGAQAMDIYLEGCK